MPTYEYECDKCRRVFEVRQRISEPALTTCDECGGAVRRLLSPAPFILKGDGWYVTDYPSESRKKAVEAEKKGSTSSTSSSEKSGDKAESKTESKASSGGGDTSTTTASAPSASS